MIHETLLFLWRYGSQLGKQDVDNHLLELRAFLHPGEEVLLKNIINIATDYHKIIDYLQEIPHFNSKTVNEGIYVRAFCNGVENVLKKYRSQIILLENMFLENPQLPLTYIFCCVDKFRDLFNLLNRIIADIDRDKLYGCLLLERLHSYVGCGMERIEKSIEQIIQSINTVFYQQLCNWIIYGNIVDGNNEFFIVDGGEPDHHFLYPEQIEKLNLEFESYIPMFNDNIRRPSFVRKFQIDWEKVPSFISEDTAESILFMGRIVWIIRHAQKKASFDHQINFKDDIWEGKDEEYYKKLQELELQCFNKVAFKCRIEECRLKLTKYLWSLMLNEGKLIEHFQLIRDYYALGRGELFQQFITAVDADINEVKMDSNVQHLNFVFHETSRKIYGENDKSFTRFELSSLGASSSKTNLHSAVNPWQLLQLNFEVYWPLHIVFHPNVMGLYNKLFCYLLRLKKTQINLHKLWSNHMSSKQKIDRRVWTLRQTLMFLINNLQYYLQVDVIEAQFSLLMKAIKNANDFEDIIKLHHDFVTHLLAKTFVLTEDPSSIYESKHQLYQAPSVKYDVPSKVYRIIMQLLEVCDDFCVKANLWQPELISLEEKEFVGVQQKSDRVIESLLNTLYTVHELSRENCLRQLLLQLDFNRYMSKHKMNLEDRQVTEAEINF